MNRIGDTYSPNTFFGDGQHLNNLKKDAHSEESLRKIAKEFEALFLQMTLKSMRDASIPMKSGLFNDSATQTYQELYDKQLAHHLSHQSQLGLADKIVEQMRPHLGEKTDKLVDSKNIINYKV